MSPSSKSAISAVPQERNFESLPTELRQPIIRQSLEYTSCREQFVYLDLEAALQTGLVSQTCFLDVADILYEDFHRLEKLSVSFMSKYEPGIKSLGGDFGSFFALSDHQHKASCGLAGASSCQFHQRFKDRYTGYFRRLRAISDALQPYHFPRTRATHMHQDTPYYERCRLIHRIRKALHCTDDTQDIEHVIRLINKEFRSARAQNHPISPLETTLPSTDHGDAKCKLMQEYVDLETKHKVLQERCDLLDTKQTQAEQEAIDSRTKYAALQKRCELLEAESARTVHDHTDPKTSYKAVQESRDVWRAEQMKTMQGKADLDIEYKALQERSDLLKAELTKTTQDHVNLQTRNKTFQADIVGLKAERREMKDRLDRTTRYREQEKQSTLGLKQDFLDLVAERKSLQGQLGLLQAKHTKTTQELGKARSQLKSPGQVMTRELVMAMAMAMVMVLLLLAAKLLL